jgi:hypothetical protein
VPRPRAKGGEAVYSGMLMFNKTQAGGAEFKKLLQAVTECGKEAYPKKALGKSLRSPFRNASEKENLPDGIVIFINPWTKQKPGVIDVDKENILDASDVWAGQLVRFNVTPFAYENSGNYGVSLALNHVQILKSEGRERLDGRKAAADSFDDEYSGYDEMEDEEI